MKTKHILLAIVIFFSICSCSKKGHYSLRVTNNTNITLVNYTVGSVQFGTIASGQTTNYYPIEGGTLTISGQTNPSGFVISGSISITGGKLFKHKFTITQNANGVSIAEDH
jgi:hypothetical protein